jgi:zinc protease
MRKIARHPSTCRSLAAAAAFTVMLAAAHADALPTVAHWHASTGARVYFVENHDLPILDVGVEFPAGSSRDTPQTSGRANLTLRVLRYGGAALSEEDVSLRLAEVGASLTPTFDTDRAGYAVRTLSSERERAQALDTLARILQEPSFAASAVERERERIIAGIKEAERKPDSVGVRAFARLVYGGHPYALRAGGEVGALQRLTPEDLAAFHAQHYCSACAVVAIVGDATRSQAEAIAEQLTARLPRSSAPPDPLPAVPALAQPASRAIAHPATQAHVLIGAPGMRRLDPDYFPLWVGNYILGGGGFSSRLYQEVREKRGLSYSVYSTLSSYEQAGSFQIGLQTRKDQAHEAIALVRATLERFIAEGPTDEEVRAAKQSIVGSFPLRIDSNQKLHDYLAVMGFYRLPLDYLDRFQENVEAVSSAQIRDAFRRRIDPQHLVTVVVGPDD